VIDVKALLHDAKGFVGTLSPTVLETGRDGALLRLDAGPELHNHLGGPHAAAIFGLGETACFAVLLEVFGDLVEAGAVPLVKGSQIAYTGIATGPLLAAATLAGDEAGARASYAQRGTAGFDVDVVFSREADGGETARATYRMVVRRM
jgi:acyl-coenzyme A thioesterase PaaI-like protein